MTDLSKLTKTQLLAHIGDLHDGVVLAVKDYPEGCDEGRIQFLRDAGIPDEVIGEYFDLTVAPQSIMVTITIEVAEGATPIQVANELESAIDRVAGDHLVTCSGYIAGIVATSEASSHVLAQEEWRRIGGKITSEDTWEDFEEIA